MRPTPVDPLVLALMFLVAFFYMTVAAQAYTAELPVDSAQAPLASQSDR